MPLAPPLLLAHLPLDVLPSTTPAEPRLLMAFPPTRHTALLKTQIARVLATLPTMFAEQLVGPMASLPTRLSVLLSTLDALARTPSVPVVSSRLSFPTLPQQALQ